MNKLCRFAVLLSVAFLASLASAEDSRITYKTMPNSTVRDYRAPAYVTEGNITYQTLPGSTTRDYRAPTYVTKGNVAYQTLPGSSVRDFSARSYINDYRKR